MTAHLDSWYHEKESAWLYAHVAAAESDSVKRDLFLKLAAAAEDQAKKWAAHSSAAPPTFKPAMRARIVAWLLGRIGPRPMRTVLAAMKLRGLSVYTAPVVPPGHVMPTSVSDVGERHRNSVGGNLRAAVFGVNDGLVSNASLVMGVAGAGAPLRYVLMTGTAGLLAGALSMACGEYVSVRSQREMFEYQIGLERDEVAEYPEEEAAELALIYHARGVELAQAQTFATALLSRPEQALDVLAREELGLNPNDLGSPTAAALVSFFSFAVGASFPLLPFVLHVAGPKLVFATASVTVIALFLVGMALSLFTGRGAWRGALRMVLLGSAAGAASYGLGHLLGGGAP